MRGLYGMSSATSCVGPFASFGPNWEAGSLIKLFGCFCAFFRCWWSGHEIAATASDVPNTRLLYVQAISLRRLGSALVFVETLFFSIIPEASFSWSHDFFTQILTCLLAEDSGKHFLGLRRSQFRTFKHLYVKVAWVSVFAKGNTRMQIYF